MVHQEDTGLGDDGLPRDLSMEEYFRLFDAWNANTVTDAEVCRRHGKGVLELLQNQFLLVSGAEKSTPEQGGVLPTARDESEFDGH